MYSVKSGADFLAQIRALDERLKNVKLYSVEVDREKGDVVYNFICDNAVDPELRRKMLDVANGNTAQAFSSVKVNVTKIVSNPELVNAEILRYLQENYKSISNFLELSDVSSVFEDGLMKYRVKLSRANADYLQKNGAVKKINDYLSQRFCSEFAGFLEVKPFTMDIDLLSDNVYEGELRKIEYRSIKVTETEIIDDATMGDVAVYLEDMKDGAGVVCGRITEIYEKTTKNGKPFFIIRIEDGTGNASGVYFSKKNTYNRISALKEGDGIIARVTIGEYNGKKSMTFERINRCDLPSEFVKQEKQKKHPPRNYSKITPEPANTVKVNSVFDDTSLPEELTSKTFVVFDIETTGLDVSTEAITEIGAVKIKDGKMTEQWTTLVHTDNYISEEIENITGITPELIKDAPTIEEVLPDFLLFAEYSTVVAHNASFDVSFIKRAATAQEYEFSPEIVDTMELSRRLFPEMRHHDLKTLATRFGIVFRHHRALSDAYATAEAFIELMKIKAKKGL